ncbi:MAG: hypothetical protein RIQ56_345, partial [Candidatus Parcubacteria bacterium]
IAEQAELLGVNVMDLVPKKPRKKRTSKTATEDTA